MVVTDLDGTLFNSDRDISGLDLHTLVTLGRKNIVRSVATGRSLFSACKLIPPDFPIDYLLFSTGAGIMHWPQQKLLMHRSMEKMAVKHVFDLLMKRGLDFMIHRPIPDNHYFLYYQNQPANVNPDFQRRLEIYRDFAQPGNPAESITAEACQIVAIQPPQMTATVYEELKRILYNLSVIRTTSPVDGQSLWIEFFNSRVSKSQAAEWVAEIYGIDSGNVLAVGNDYNDLDLLRWAGRSFMVSNCPPELRHLFPAVSSNDEGGFSHAVSLWAGPAADFGKGAE